METAIALNVHHPVIGSGQLDAQRHASAVTQATPCTAQKAQRLGARNLLQHRG